MYKSFTTALIVLFACNLQSQSCGCTINQVENNTVKASDKIIGTVVNVSTTQELNNAFNQANNSGGDMTILIADGTYPIASTSSYPYLTASNLVIRSASGNRDAVIITGQGMKDVAPLTEIGLSLQGDNITVADLTIRDVGNHGISTNSDNHMIHNVRIQNTYEQMIKGTSSGNGSNDCVVQCSLFEYTAGVGPQWYIGGLDIHEGINWTVNDNIFIDIASPSVTLAEHAVHFWDGSADNTVERNIMINCDRGVGFGLGSSPNDGGIIRNNMIFNDGTSLYHDVGIGLETSPNTQVYNNTIHIQYPNAIEYRFVASNNIGIANNLVNQAIQSRNGGTANVVSNITNGNISWYEDPSNGNLRVSNPISTVTDQGIELPGLVDVDVDQLARPQGSSTDIGAHEFFMLTDNDSDGFTSDVDCDDDDPDINPDAVEIPNNDVDENCDSIVLIIDADMDGYNSFEDCDETNPAINPGAIEIPDNGIDENCDGLDLISDVDMDGFGADVDCDDNNPNVYPGAMEIPNNSIDEDCDGIALMIDDDMDGFNSDEDCDDNNAAINPDATEIPNNTIDEDCDGVALIIDDDMDGFNSDEDCDDNNAAINPDATEIPNNTIDEDCDGIALMIDDDMDGFNSDEDCDDNNAAINPDATEIPNNTIDEDCDGVALIIDDDMDGFNSDEDCDDNNAAINPDAIEIPNNGIDEDCDGMDGVSANTEVLKIDYSIFPNPVKNETFLILEKREQYNIVLLNLYGKIILQNIESPRIDFSEIPAGIYILTIRHKTNFQSASTLLVHH